MAKDNLFLGTARGSVGDVVFSRLNGVQVSRVRNRAPRNPQSPAQMIQRIIMATVGKAYSFMSDICNHSFENFEEGQLSQRKFMEVNVGLMRDRLAAVLEFPVEDVILSSNATNFNYKNDFLPVFNEYIISAGSLDTVPLAQTSDGYLARIPFDAGEKTQAQITYADIVAGLNLRRGDQLTFIQVTRSSTVQDRQAALMANFYYSRIILEPSDGDMSGVFFNSSGTGVSKPNERNSGTFRNLVYSTENDVPGIQFFLRDTAQIASAVIASRKSGDKWLRSTQTLLPRRTGETNSPLISYLSQAYLSYLTGSASDLYLNQAT